VFPYQSNSQTIILEYLLYLLRAAEAPDLCRVHAMEASRVMQGTQVLHATYATPPHPLSSSKTIHHWKGCPPLHILNEDVYTSSPVTHPPGWYRCTTASNAFADWLRGAELASAD